MIAQGSRLSTTLLAIRLARHYETCRLLVDISYEISVPDTITIVQPTHEPRDQLDRAGSPANHDYLQAYCHTSPM
jgi:hypothetical protein